ncbi:hypothetical protein L202_00798 [Cryptococcus amylolentus CBS 6039]|uniref:Uncharacterized protein n=2 Tax=Cryptococcus amylolentus TaxID=104669 RepID=A0A1E3I8P0_9TREE|nr:hypothetical protein L202_00798 [Cryptococcus amylolentus CBS 6039]ODN84954.1 hypothetical protein L202_00798 [Cryptococcus amylolentus CBS 6039]ODO11348.1 hypothetical protein I350_00127 [Cryptococcus amylolentus CBS 6273]
MSAEDSAMDITVSNDEPRVESMEYGWKGIYRGDDLTSQCRISKNDGTELSTAIQLFGSIDGFEGVLNIEIAEIDLEDDLDNEKDWTKVALSRLIQPGEGERYANLTDAVKRTYYYASEKDKRSHRKFIREELATIYKMIVESNQSGASSVAASPEEEDIDMEG